MAVMNDLGVLLVMASLRWRGRMGCDAGLVAQIFAGA
jgi:hypothetical protein